MTQSASVCSVRSTGGRGCDEAQGQLALILKLYHITQADLARLANSGLKSQRHLVASRGQIMPLFQIKL